MSRPDKISLTELQQLVKQRFSRKLRKGRKLKLMWLTGDGHSVVIDSQRSACCTSGSTNSGARTR